MIALEFDGQIVLGLATSPAQGRRWWATRGHGSFTGPSDRSARSQIFVSTRSGLTPDRVVTLPGYDRLLSQRQDVIAHIAGGRPVDMPWSHPLRIAEGELDLCVWFGGGVWDHAAPSILVEEAGGRFTDHHGGTRFDTRTAVYSNGVTHDGVLAALRALYG